jgi:hypothetical protein
MTSVAGVSDTADKGVQGSDFLKFRGIRNFMRK